MASQLIRSLLTRNLNQKIEEVIKLDQTDEFSVHSEITEYVVTGRIKLEYEKLLRAIADAPNDPSEGIGVWISGFFGSGKSSFAKNLGYVLSNKKVLDQQTADLFKLQVDDQAISALIDSINTRIPTEVIMFDVSKDRSQAGHGGLSISPYVYRVLLRELGYAEDFDLAELEISLEQENRLEAFIERYNRRYADGDQHNQNTWTRRGRKSSEVWNRAGAILQEMDPATYPTPESFAQKLTQNRVDITPRLLVDRTFELVQRRKPGKTVAFIIDEVGQYVAYNQERLEDLRAVVELFGIEGKNRVRSRQIPAPVWFIVTSQERLDEVTSAMSDERRILLAKVRDRFRYEVDLSPADIREVATRRVLDKTKDGEKDLQRLYDNNQGLLNTACHLEANAWRTEVNRTNFINFYPYLPHYIDLSIDIVSGIRLQPGAMRHIGGSNRTIISQVYEMLVNPRTNFAERPIGSLVTLDFLYELIEGQLGTNRQGDINNIAQRFDDIKPNGYWAARVAKVILLLEFIRNLPRTEANISALLVNQIGQPAPVPQVNEALKMLVDAQFIRNTEGGYKLQTLQEKNWQVDRSRIDVRQRNRDELVREMVGKVFNDEKIKEHRYQNRTFRIGLNVNGMRSIEEGQFSLFLLVGDSLEEMNAKLAEATQESRQPKQQNNLYWVFSTDPQIFDLLNRVYQGREMVKKYDQLSAQQQITSEDITSLGMEKRELTDLETRLQDLIRQVVSQGRGVFRGVSRDGASLGRSTAEIFRNFYDYALPELYPKLELGTFSVKGTEADEVLKAANLNSLSTVFYSGGMGLISQENGRYFPNTSAEIAKEVLDYLKREHSYGTRVTGSVLAEHFSSVGYGWDTDIVKIVLALLLRAGAIELTYQGKRYRSHSDPQCRIPFTNNTAFKAASFTPRESITLQNLTNAVTALEDLTGEEVDVEEVAIADAFKKLADAELRQLLQIEATSKAYRLPIQESLEKYHRLLTEIREAPSDECLRILIWQGQDFKSMKAVIQKIRESITEANLAKLHKASIIVEEIGPALSNRTEGQNLGAKLGELKALLGSASFYENLKEIQAFTNEIFEGYRQVYNKLHQTRQEDYSKILREIQERADWEWVSEPLRQLLPQALLNRLCYEEDPLREGNICHVCRATLSQMDSDILALPILTSNLIAKIQEVTAPQTVDNNIVPIKRLRVQNYFSAVLDSEEAVNKAVDKLRKELLEMIANGARIVVE